MQAAPKKLFLLVSQLVMLPVLQVYKRHFQYIPAIKDLAYLFIVIIHYLPPYWKDGVFYRSRMTLGEETMWKIWIYCLLVQLR